MTGIQNSSLAWGDYDNDGDLDLIITGSSTLDGPISRIYRNDLGAFNDISAALPGVSRGSVAWGDYDNDGDLDILLTGYISNLNYISKIYRNDSGVFTDINANLEGVYYGFGAWGDYDNDGDLDILLSGISINSSSLSKIYRNNNGVFTDIQAGLTGVSGSSGSWG
jgi:predicted nucleotidyltransferase